jgi:HK97 family phage major capsid protein
MPAPLENLFFKDTNMISQLAELKTQRAAALSSLDALAQRTLTPEEQTAFDGLVSQVGDIDARVTILEDAANIAADNTASMGQNSAKLETLKRSEKRSSFNIPSVVKDLNDAKSKINHANSIRGWFTKGTPAFRSEFAVAANETGIDLNSNTLTFDKRAAQSSASGGNAASLVNSGFFGTLTEALRQFNCLMQYGTIIDTADGNDLNFPCVDDTAVTGELLGQNSATAQTAFTAATKTLGAWKFSSKQILTSYELFQDSLLDVESLVAKIAGTRLGRITESNFTIGDGSSKPTGIVVGANASAEIASSTAVTVAEVRGLIASLDPAYASSPTCAFMCNSTTAAQLASLADTAGRPLLVSDYVSAAGRLPTIYGYPVIINNNMVSQSSASKFLVFGDIKAYTIRTVSGGFGMTLVRQNETYAASGQIGWVAMARFDGAVLAANATTYNPIQVLKSKTA